VGCVGLSEGTSVGDEVGLVGSSVGVRVGDSVGLRVGASVRHAMVMICLMPSMFHSFLCGGPIESDQEHFEESYRMSISPESEGRLMTPLKINFDTNKGSLILSEHRYCQQCEAKPTRPLGRRGSIGSLPEATV
jgi:hypothetical protein